MATSKNISAAAAEKKEAPLLPAYLIVGEDELKQQAVVKRLRARINNMGDLEFNHDVFQGEEVEGGTVVSACDTMPFAAEVRLVEVTNADKLHKADSEALVTYLGNPSPTTVLCLIATKLAKNTRLYKAVAALGKSAVIPCEPKRAAELPGQVRQIAVTYGVTFSDRAARKLIELVGENTVKLDAEIRKIALSHNSNDAVSDREVEGMVVRVSEPKPWELVDAMSDRNLGKCMKLLSYMENPSPYALLAQCMKRIRELVCVRSLLDRGERGRIPAELKLSGKRAWLADKYIERGKLFTSRELRNIVIEARNTEQAMKSGADPMGAYLDWLILVCNRSRR